CLGGLLGLDGARGLLCIGLPAADVTHGILGDLGGGGVADPLHEDVHAALPRCPVAEILSVRADAEASLLGVLEEIAHRDGGRWCIRRWHVLRSASTGAEQGDPRQQGGADQGSHGHAMVCLWGKDLVRSSIGSAIST
ncbi:MAG: hypothetical protein ACK56I_35895, partial [bacterium]